MSTHDASVHATTDDSSVELTRALAHSNDGMRLASEDNFRNALICFQHAFLIYQKELGIHANTAATAVNVANCYAKLSLLDDAAHHLELALSIQRACGSGGQPHADAAATLTNLAILAERRGDFRTALWYAESSLRLHIDALGLDAPATAKAMEELADCYEANGDLERASTLRAHAASSAARRAGAAGFYAPPPASGGGTSGVGW